MPSAPFLKRADVSMGFLILYDRKNSSTSAFVSKSKLLLIPDYGENNSVKNPSIIICLRAAKYLIHCTIVNCNCKALLQS